MASEDCAVNYRETSTRLAEYRRQIAGLRDKMREARAAAEPEEVPDYVFTNSSGSVRLSELFGDKPDLIVIHNMGATCPHCTLWADGFNGIYDHLASRATFVLSSPDTPSTQKTFAASRGWRFPMVSHTGTTFAADMGYRTEDGGWLPGTSVFRRELNRILRVSDAGFNPGDDFCVLWHIFDLLPGGAGDWRAKYRYG
jgi:predicted dithiol-disulfide oxidoreductase (DUF899 family)